MLNLNTDWPYFTSPLKIIGFSNDVLHFSTVKIGSTILKCCYINDAEPEPAGSCLLFVEPKPKFFWGRFENNTKKCKKVFENGCKRAFLIRNTGI